jgi:hypothetical protein
MSPSPRQLKLTDARSNPMVPAASAAGLSHSNRGKASSNRPAQVVSAVRRPDAYREPIADSDRDAHFASVVLPHLADAYALARWLTGNSADAEDVVQDACLRAFRGIGNFYNGDARAWVLTIVRHTTYGWLRKNRPAALVLVEDVESVERAQSGENARDGALRQSRRRATRGGDRGAAGAVPGDAGAARRPRPRLP